MSPRFLPVLIVSLGIAGTLCGCSSLSSKLVLQNATGKTLTAYPVVTSPPPPHREASTKIPNLDRYRIDPAGFNPVFYTPGVTDTTKANGLYIGLPGDEPFQILYRVFHYRVAPGDEGHDPALQPILLHEAIQDVDDVDQTITVSTFTSANTPPGGWTVTIHAN